MRFIYLTIIFASIILFASCSDDINRSNPDDKDSASLKLKFDNNQADTLLALYVDDLATNYSYNVDSVLFYTIVEKLNSKYFYAKVKANQASTHQLIYKEIVIKFAKAEDNIEHYITEPNYKSTIYDCYGAEECEYCGFETEGDDLSIHCKCKSGTNNSDCTLQITSNLNLWDNSKYLNGKSILEKIPIATFTPLSTTWPF